MARCVFHHHSRLGQAISKSWFKLNIYWLYSKPALSITNARSGGFWLFGLCANAFFSVEFRLYFILVFNECAVHIIKLNFAINEMSNDRNNNFMRVWFWCRWGRVTFRCFSTRFVTSAMVWCESDQSNQSGTTFIAPTGAWTPIGDVPKTACWFTLPYFSGTELRLSRWEPSRET